MLNIKTKRIIISIIAILVTLTVAYLLLSLKDKPLEQIVPWLNEEKSEDSGTTLSPAEYEQLLENLKPSPTATPTLSDAEYEQLLENLKPSPTATPTLTDAEYEQLLENLRPRR
jgi:hypothetical protein